MAIRRVDNKYWYDKQEKLCAEWLYSGNTQVDYTRIYNALHPAMYMLVDTILHRYFYSSYSKETELKADCMTEVFLKLKHYNPQRQKAYTYCSLIAKYYYHDVIVVRPNYIKNTQVEYTDEEGALDSVAVGIDYGEKRDIDFLAIYRHFKTVEEKLVKRFNKISTESYKQDLFYPARLKRHNRQLEILRLCVEFIKKFQSVNMNHMAEYCFLNSKMKRYEVLIQLKTLLGINATIPKDSHLSYDEKTGYNYMNDDYTPIENYRGKRQNIKNKKKNAENPEDYQYF